MLTSRARQWVTSSAVRLCTMFKFDADDFAHSTSFVAVAFSHWTRAKFYITQNGWRRRIRGRRRRGRHQLMHTMCIEHTSGNFNKSNHFLIRHEERYAKQARVLGMAWSHEGWSVPHVLCLITFFPYVLFRLRIKTIWSGCGSLWRIFKGISSRRSADVCYVFYVGVCVFFPFLSQKNHLQIHLNDFEKGRRRLNYD